MIQPGGNGNERIHGYSHAGDAPVAVAVDVEPGAGVHQLRVPARQHVVVVLQAALQGQERLAFGVRRRRSEHQQGRRGGRKDDRRQGQSGSGRCGRHGGRVGQGAAVI